MSVCERGAFGSYGKVASAHQFQAARHRYSVYRRYGHTRIVNDSFEHIGEQEEIAPQPFLIVQAAEICLEIPAGAERSSRARDDKRLSGVRNRFECPNEFVQHLFIERV
jgi:hypothetical protein